MSGDRGQANVELIALLGVIAAVIASAAAIAGPGAPTILNALTTGIQRALCVVAGQRCAALDPEPCPTQRTTEHHRLRATVAFIKVGAGRTLQIERRSDGSYLLTLLEGPDLGIGFQYAGGDTAAEIAGTGGPRLGRAHHVATAAEAQALIRKLRVPGLPSALTAIRGAADLSGLAASEPDVDHYLLAGRSGIDALASLGFQDLLTTSAAISIEAQAGVKISARRKEATLYVDLRGDAKVAFQALSQIDAPMPRRRRPTTTAPKDPPGTGGGGGVDLRKRAPDATTPPPAARPRNRLRLKNPHPIAGEARAVTGGHLAVTLGPGGQILGIELIGTRTAHGTTHELRARLDPDAPGLGPAIDAWRRDPTDRGALDALGQAAADGSALDQRTYRHRATNGRKGKVGGRGLGLGLTLDDATETLDLIEQRSRPIGGIWATRLDC